MTQANKRKILVFLAVVLAIFIVVSIVATVFVAQQMKEEFGRAERREYSTGILYSDYEMMYPRSEISFYSGKNLLRGYLYGEGNTDGIVIISHGIGGGADDYMAETFRFVSAGYEVLAYNNTGSYESEGEGTMGLTQSYLDLDAALDFVESDARFEDLPIYLYGHSWGGYAVAAVLKEDHHIAAAVSVAGYNNPNEMIKEWTENSMGLIQSQLASPYIALYNFLKFGFKSNISATDAINSTNTPILIAHGRNDLTVSYGRASIISHRYEITNPKAQFYTGEKLGQDGHNTLFMSQTSVTYSLKLDQELAALKAQYGEELPDEVKREFYENIDRDYLNMLDGDFMQMVIDFFRSARPEDDFLKQLLGQ